MSCLLNDIVALQWQIDDKIKPLAAFVGLDIPTVETLLARQYARWLQSGGDPKEN